MSKGEFGTSQTLGARIAELKAKMRSANVTENDMKAFQKVAALMGCDAGSLRLNADDLIAASFVADTISERTLNCSAARPFGCEKDAIGL
ncbi:hypothetical protein JQK88_22025 [Mesorhizobium caraganae]|uniref:hypothetical protein n=1 Tax=Mesorhizobium caraganae TaxID=483206 RepID=UPI001939D2F4|nr:hypothetical protein [Mesorhizobium caraganae]MBM2713844.1 hypothetical protein [Mesorhizobium caraganae]